VFLDLDQQDQNKFSRFGAKAHFHGSGSRNLRSEPETRRLRYVSETYQETIMVSFSVSLSALQWG
jgi:hypothetical protein